MLDDNTEDDGKGVNKKGYSKGVFDETYKSFGKAADSAVNVGSTMNAANEATILLNTSLGGSANLISTISTNFIDAGQQLLFLNNNVETLEQGMLMAAKTNKELMDATGRAYIASSDELAGIIAAQEASGVQAKDLLEKFKAQGYALEGIPKTIQKVIDTTRQLGVNSAAVTETVVANIGKLNTFNFSNGVEGLTRMAAQAAVVGVDMGKIFSISEDMFNPERAVEMASSLQRLGVATGDLLDPLKLMDLGQNNPQELQNQIVEMSKRFTYFNEQNQKFEILPGAKLQLREVAKELGMNADELARMAIGSSDLAKKMNEIKFPELETGALTEDQRTMIANLSEMKDGEYKIKVQETITDKETGERIATGKTVEKSITKLTDEDIKSLQFAQKEGTKTLEEIALESMSVQKRSENLLEYIASTGKGSLLSTNLANKGQELLNKTIGDLVGLTKEGLSTKEGRTFLNEAAPILKDFGAEMLKAYDDGKISEQEKTQLMESGKKIDEKFSSAFGKATNVFSKFGKYVKDFPGEVMKAIDAATQSVEGESVETTTTQTKETEPAYMKAQTGAELMEGTYQEGRKVVNSQQPITNNNQNVNTTNNTQTTNNNVNTTNTTAANTNYDQTFIDQTKNITNQMANNSNLFDLSPMVNLQGEQLTASKGSLSELQSLNANLANNNQELIKVLSGLDMNFETPTNTTTATLNSSNLPTDNTTQIVNVGQNLSDNTTIQKVSDVVTPNNTDMSQIGDMMSMNTPQNSTSTFDGKLTIDVNISAPPGVDVAAIKEVVTQTMHDSKVRDNINQSVISPRIGSYNPTTGIPT